MSSATQAFVARCLRNVCHINVDYVVSENSKRAAATSENTQHAVGSSLRVSPPLASVAARAELTSQLRVPAEMVVMGMFWQNARWLDLLHVAALTETSVTRNEGHFDVRQAGIWPGRQVTQYHADATNRCDEGASIGVLQPSMPPTSRTNPNQTQAVGTVGLRAPAGVNGMTAVAAVPEPRSAR